MVTKRGYLNYYVDVSGGPGEKTIFGLIGIQNTDLAKVMKDVRKQFPKITSKQCKSARLDPSELESILAFLDKKDVVMRALVFSNSDWNYLKKRYQSFKKHFYSRMFGILYARLLQDCSFKKHLYTTVFCNEDYLSNKELAKKICLEVSRYDGYDFAISHSDHKTYPPLKLADIVAGGVRKLGKAKMNEFSSFKLVNKKIPTVYLIKAFGKYRETS